MGQLYPRIGAWVTDTVGTFVSAWLEQGLQFAVGTTAQGVVNTIPGLGPLLQKRILDGRYVPTFMEVLANKDIAKVLNHSTDLVAKTGKTGREIYLIAARGGVLNHVISEDVLRINERSMLRNAAGMGIGRRGSLFKKYRQAWVDHYEHAQRARNISVFVNFLQEGKSEKEAIEQTLKITYDWRMAVSEAERTYMAVLATFYTFSRLQMAQINRVFMEPLMDNRAAGKILSDALHTRTKISRAREQVVMTSHMPEWLSEEDYYDQSMDSEQYEAALRRRLSWWFDNRFIYDVQSMPVSDQEWYRDHGKPASHYVRSVPTFSTVEGLYTYGLMVQLLWLAGMEAASAPFGGQSTQLHDNAASMVIDEVTKRMSPLLQDVVQAFVDKTIREDAYSSRLGETARLPETAVLDIANKIGFGNLAITDDYGRKKIPPAVAYALKQLPVVNEIGNAYIGFDNPKAMDGYAEYLNFMFGHFTGIGRMSPINPKADIDSAMRIVDQELRYTKLKLQTTARPQR
jgi:hypothetical protein